MRPVSDHVHSLYLLTEAALRGYGLHETRATVEQELSR